MPKCAVSHEGTAHMVSNAGNSDAAILQYQRTSDR